MTETQVELARGIYLDTGNPDASSRIVHMPVGVCGLITPWNYPLLQVSWKVAPALLAGNTFVLKPSELTPSTAVLLMETLREAGVPAGVVNLVTGTGPEVGAVLSTDPRVDLVSFTGGLATGKRIMSAAAGTVKRVALELGGKNPNIVFADADREAAVDFALTAVFLHSGQVCSAGVRLIVEESIHEEFVAEVARRARNIRLGGPIDELAETGPLISFAHRDRVHACVRAGMAEGATLACGGIIPDGVIHGSPELAAGSYYWAGLILLGGLLAAPDLSDPKVGAADGGLQYIVLAVLGGPFGKAFLVCIVVAVVVCTLAVHAAAIRMMFAMARDNNLPFSRQLSRVHPVRKTPTVEAIVIGIIAVVPLIVNVSQPAIFTILSSISIVLIYLSYLLVTVPMLRKRLRKKWPLAGDGTEPGFSLGKWGVPVNILAVLWGGAMTLTLIWPRPEIYNSVPPFEWYLQWGGVMFVGAVTIGGVPLYRLRIRHHTGLLAEHAAPAADATVAGDPVMRDGDLEPAQ